MTKKLRTLALLLCVSALATLSSCSKDPESLGVEWTCTYNTWSYNRFTENQYVGTVWNFSNEVADEDLHYYYLYINGIQVGSYELYTHREPNCYVITADITNTEYREIVDYIHGMGSLDIKGNTLEMLTWDGEPLITWTKGSGSGSGTSGGGSGSGTGGGNGSGTGGGNGSGTSGGGHGGGNGGGTGKSASNNGIGNWNSSFASATKTHSLMFSEGENVEIRK